MFESIAYAAAPAQRQAEGNPIISFLPIILMVFILYFLMVRPQQKRQRELQKMVTELKKGDCVVTAGGIIGTITSVQNDYVVMKVGDGDTKMEVLKSAISGLRTKSE